MNRMYQAIWQLILLAQQDRFDRGLSMFRWGITLAGVGILVVAVGLMFSKSKGDAKEMSPATKVIAAGIVAAVGLGLIAYAWLIF